MTRPRLVATLGLGVALGAVGGFFLFDRGLDVLGARSRRPAAQEGRSAEPSADGSATATPEAAAWQPAPIRFRAVAGLGGLSSAVFGGAPAFGDLEGDGDADLFVAGGPDAPC